MTLLVTGAAGFVGSSLVRHLRAARPDECVVSVDCLTYAGSRENLACLDGDPLHVFERVAVQDEDEIERVFSQYEPRGVFHLAAETHVDRSILVPLTFVETNVQGTAVLLQVAQRHWGSREDVRFVHLSTDEVFGELGEKGFFCEGTPYTPRNPYAASKAAADHLVRAWHRTYGFPAIVTHSSNNYGPRQFPEKLIPVVISRAVEGENIPVYGSGDNVRDWIYVDDHCRALTQVFKNGNAGETYCIGANCEFKNIDVVYRVCDEVDRCLGNEPGTARALVRFVEDRPGHDRRYAMDPTKLRTSLGWSPTVHFDEGLSKTVRWYLEHQDWCRRLRSRTKEFESAWYQNRV